MINRLLRWLDSSTCNFLAVDTITKELNIAGFRELRQEDSWKIEFGGKYYVVKNGTAIFAFIAGKGTLMSTVSVSFRLTPTALASNSSLTRRY